MNEAFYYYSSNFRNSKGYKILLGWPYKPYGKEAVFGSALVNHHMYAYLFFNELLLVVLIFSGFTGPNLFETTCSKSFGPKLFANRTSTRSFGCSLIFYPREVSWYLLPICYPLCSSFPFFASRLSPLLSLGLANYAWFL